MYLQNNEVNVMLISILVGVFFLSVVVCVVTHTQHIGQGPKDIQKRMDALAKRVRAGGLK